MPLPSRSRSSYLLRLPLLNVYLGGTLIQDCERETDTTLPHRKRTLCLNLNRTEGRSRHAAAFEHGSLLAAITGAH